jgi:hypothetical protein
MAASERPLLLLLPLAYTNHDVGIFAAGSPTETVI